MRRFAGVSIVASLIVLAGMDADAARGCRPARRNCVGVTHQPCASASIKAPKSETAATDYMECVCAFYAYAFWGDYYSYYAYDYTPDCNHGHYCSLDGNFATGNPDPCPTCPGNQCVNYSHAALKPGGGNFKPGTKLTKKLKWDEKVVLKSGTTKMTTPAGKNRDVAVETKELTDARMLVSFTSGNTLYFAKLHVCRIEAQDLQSKTLAVTDFAVGQEIEEPPAGQKIIDVTNQITIKEPNVAHVKVGNTTYQIVTATTLTE
jgi:hypothetical protein